MAFFNYSCFLFFYYTLCFINKSLTLFSFVNVLVLLFNIPRLPIYYFILCACLNFICFFSSSGGSVRILYFYSLLGLQLVCECTFYSIFLFKLFVPWSDESPYPFFIWFIVLCPIIFFGLWAFVVIKFVLSLGDTPCSSFLL